jgi:chromosome segregation ATPase
MEPEKAIRQLDDQIYKLDREVTRIKDDVAGLQDTQQLITSKLSSILADSTKLHNLFKVVVEGDGEPSLKTQATLLQRDFQSLKEAITGLPDRLDFSVINQQLSNLESQLAEIRAQAERTKQIKDNISTKVVEIILGLIITAMFGLLVNSVLHYKQNTNKKEGYIDEAASGYIVMHNEYNFLDKG